MVRNNSIVQIATSDSVTELECISASGLADVGQFVSPNGNDLTNDSAMVTVGGVTDPGFASLQLASYTRSNPGVYTCVIPDENGVLQHLHVGIYGRFNGMVRLKFTFLTLMKHTLPLTSHGAWETVL